MSVPVQFLCPCCLSFHISPNSFIAALISKLSRLRYLQSVFLVHFTILSWNSKCLMFCLSFRNDFRTCSEHDNWRANALVSSFIAWRGHFNYSFAIWQHVVLLYCCGDTCSSMSTTSCFFCFIFKISRMLRWNKVQTSVHLSWIVQYHTAIILPPLSPLLRLLAPILALI